LVEHDQHPSIEHPPVRLGNLYQRIPWTENQLIGDQYILAAIAQDDQWISNFGGRLNRYGRLLLGSLRHRGGEWFEPIIISYNKCIYVQDSDPFVDRLAAYQYYTLNELVHRNREVRLLNLLFILASLRIQNLYGFISTMVIAVGLLISNCKNRIGDIRIVAPIFSPHETSRPSGVLRSLADNGFCFVKGDSQCTVLIVGEGKSVTAKASETLVILMPGARLKIGDDFITVDSMPLGDISDVVDARALIVNGTMQSFVIKINKCNVIGTGSPAKQNWKKWLKS
jgi:hypothetical protein